MADERKTLAAMLVEQAYQLGFVTCRVEIMKLMNQQASTDIKTYDVVSLIDGLPIPPSAAVEAIKVEATKP